MPISATALTRLQESADPAEAFSNVNAAIILFNYGVLEDSEAIILEATGYLLEWALVLYDPGDVWSQIRQMVEALTKVTPGFAAEDLPNGLQAVVDFVEEFYSLLVEIFITPDLLLIAPLPENVLQRVSNEIGAWSSLRTFTIA